MVQPGDNIYSIAERYHISVEKLAFDNGVAPPYNLVVGQALIIVHPKLTHIVQQGDTLQSIASMYDVPVMQIIRNNQFLSEREFLYSGDTLTISYDTKRSIITNGFAYPFIRQETLIKTLPYLTYLSIFNYTIQEGGAIENFHDDTEIVTVTKAYGTLPLLMVTTVNRQGTPNIELTYRILLNEEYQDRVIATFLEIMKNKGYMGANLVLNNLTEDNQLLYQNFIQKVASRLQEEQLQFFITINYSAEEEDRAATFENIDYLKITTYVNGVVFLHLNWGTIDTPPAPVSNIEHIRALINYVTASIPPDKIIIGKPTLGYDWQLPFIPGSSSVNSLTINSALDLAYQTGAVIEFDENSQTPFYYYMQFGIGLPLQHIVWFVDVRSIDALNKLIMEYGLGGSGIWNIMIYYAPLWTIIIAEFDIIKLF